MNVNTSTGKKVENISAKLDDASFITVYMVEKYGPLMNLVQLAEVLNRTYNGLRMGLQVESEFSNRVNACKIRMGRRIHFKTPEIAKILDGN